MRVLMVDDDDDVGQCMSEVVKSLGHETCLSKTGSSGIEQAATWHPDIVFLDIGLPDLDGYEVARRIRLIRREEPVKLIALTGYGRDRDRDLALKAGFDLHILKPLELSVLEKVLSECGPPGN